MSLLIIVGAGASYDSYATDPPVPGSVNDEDRLPLANELFDSRHEFQVVLDRFPGCLPLLPRLRHLRGRTIEEEFEQLRAESTAGGTLDSLRIRQLASVRFYIQALIDMCEGRWYSKTHGATNLLTLLDDVRRLAGSDVSIVTFNYDRLIERAIQRLFGHAPGSIDDYVNLGPFALFKVHGSVNWGREVENHATDAGNDCEHITASLIDNAASLKTTDNFYLVTKEQPPVVRYGTELVLLPAIAVPIRTKQYFECPSTHLGLLNSRLSNVNRILVIGWRGMDRHFLGLLKQHLRRQVAIQIVTAGQQDSEQVAGNIAESGIDATYDPRPETFSTYIVSRAGQLFLTESGRNP